MTNNELKPCPFCGGESGIKEYQYYLYPVEYVVCCTCCHRETGLCETKQQAIDAWNRRVVEADGSEQT